MANYTSINKSRIFKRAWELHRFVHNSYAPWQIEQGYVDGSFAHSLRASWDEEKCLVKAAQSRAAHSVEIKQLEARKEVLQYSPIGHQIGNDLASLDRQINKLIAAQGAWI